MTRACRLTVLFFSLATALALAVPRVTSVEPDAVVPGGSAVAKGSDLGKGSVASLYLTAGGSDVKVEITEQSAEAISFKLPDSTEMKRYRLMVLTSGAGAAYMEQPIALEVVDEATAKQRAEEGEVELEIIEAEPAEEEEEEQGRRRRRNR
ncbi:MAG: hypothetical protein OXN97_22100 [Bryobacterales bacterium]|nr:hypothetical protein [Bryobacterales bacterium]MDE0626919.1 hypothetical protein [Bryobacterales bacterium]